MDAATASHIIAQVERVLAAEIIYENRRVRSAMNMRLRDILQSRERASTVDRAIHPTPLPEVRFESQAKSAGRNMSVTGLDSGIIQASIEKAKQRLAAKVNDGVSKIETATAAGESKIDGVTSNLAAKIDKEIEDQVSAFVTLTNGGPL